MQNSRAAKVLLKVLLETSSLEHKNLPAMTFNGRTVHLAWHNHNHLTQNVKQLKVTLISELYDPPRALYLKNIYH